MAMSLAPRPFFSLASPSPRTPTATSTSTTCSSLNSAFSRTKQLQLEAGKVERRSGRFAKSRLKCRAGLEALVFDCDGVILESEDLHRRAYNAAFEEFEVRCSQSPEPVAWDPELYDELQNTVGGGKEKMRWFFSKYGWPTSTIMAEPPASENDQATLIDRVQKDSELAAPVTIQYHWFDTSCTSNRGVSIVAVIALRLVGLFYVQPGLEQHDWKSKKYQDIIGSGAAEPRPGVLQLMDESRAKGLKLAVCSAATKSSVVFTLSNLLGKERFEALDCFLAGTDVDKKKPDPSIYIKASKELGIAPENCLVVEDSVIGLKAASGAGMACIISYTSSTSKQDFSASKAVYSDLGSVRIQDLVELVEGIPATK